MARGRFGAVHAVAPFGDVEIDLHDAPLSPQRLDHEREIDLERFAHIGTTGPKEGVLRGLLADRRGAARRAATPRIVNGVADLVEVEAVMMAELVVFRSYDGANEVGRDLRQRRPLIAHAVAEER